MERRGSLTRVVGSALDSHVVVTWQPLQSPLKRHMRKPAHRQRRKGGVRVVTGRAAIRDAWMVKGLPRARGMTGVTAAARVGVAGDRGVQRIGKRLLVPMAVHTAEVGERAA